MTDHQLTRYPTVRDLTVEVNGARHGGITRVSFLGEKVSFVCLWPSVPALLAASEIALVAKGTKVSMTVKNPVLDKTILVVSGPNPDAMEVMVVFDADLLV